MKRFVVEVFFPFCFVNDICFVFVSMPKKEQHDTWAETRARAQDSTRSVRRWRKLP